MANNRFDKQLYFVEPKKRALLPIGYFKYSKSIIRLCKKKPFEITRKYHKQLTAQIGN